MPSDSVVAPVPPAGLVAGELLEPHASAITAFVWSPDGSLAAIGCVNGELRIWDWRARAAKHTFKISPAARINCLAWAQSGSAIAVGCDDGQVRIFDCASWSPRPHPPASPSSIHSLVWSRDEKLLVAGCREQLIRGWQVADAQLVFALHIHQGWARTVMLGDDATIVSAGDDGYIRVWTLDTGEIVRTLPKTGPLLELAVSPVTRELVS